MAPEQSPMVVSHPPVLRVAVGNTVATTAGGLIRVLSANRLIWPDVVSERAEVMEPLVLAGESPGQSRGQGDRLQL